MLKKMISFAAVAGLVLALGPVAQAEVIGGVSYIQPTIESTTHTSASDGDTYNGPVEALVDGSGIVAATGLSDTPARSDGFSTVAGGGNNIVFDLGAEYELTGAHIWSRTYGTIGGGPNFQSGYGGLKKFTISTSLSSATTGNAFTTPIDTFAVTDLPGFNDGAFPMPTAGSDVPMAVSGPARYVMFASAGNGTSWYTHRNRTDAWGLNEVRFYPIPEPATMTLVLLGLPFVMRRRKRR